MSELNTLGKLRSKFLFLKKMGMIIPDVVFDEVNEAIEEAQKQEEVMYQAMEEQQNRESKWGEQRICESL